MREAQKHDQRPDLGKNSPGNDQRSLCARQAGARLDRLATGFAVRSVQQNEHGVTTTWSDDVPEVPGEIVSQCQRKVDPQGRIVRRSTLELVGYGVEGEETTREPIHLRSAAHEAGSVSRAACSLFPLVSPANSELEPRWRGPIIDGCTLQGCIPPGPPPSFRSMSGISDTFNGYHVWLGIPPAEQPPNHYRLLGITVFETDADVIDHSADRQMAHVRTFQSGKHGAFRSESSTSSRPRGYAC